MINQKFLDKRNRTVTVVDIEDNIATLNNGERVSVERMKDPDFYRPYSHSTHNKINESQSQIDHSPQDLDDYNNSRYQRMLKGSNIVVGEEDNGPMTEVNTDQRINQHSQIKQSGSVVESHRKNLKSLGVDVPPESKKRSPQTKVQNEQTILEKYKHLYNSPEKNSNQDISNSGDSSSNKSLQEVQESFQSNVSNTDKAVNTNVDDEKETNPVFQMFDKAKKTHPLKLNLKIDEKIPNRSVIKMMEENFDESAIDYFTKMVFKKIMEDPTVIEKQIKQSINNYVNNRNNNTKSSNYNKRKTSSKK